MTQAGPAMPVVAVTDRSVEAGPALRVAVVSDGRAVEGGPARPVIVVSDGRPTQGNEPIPIMVATGAQAGRVMAGPAIPIVIVNGGSVQPNMLYSNKVNALGPIAYWPLAEASGTTIVDESGNGRNGTYSNVTLGQTGIGDGRTAASFNGSTSVGDVFSASLQSAFNGAEGSMMVWLRAANAGVWTDGVNRRMFRFAADGNNDCTIRKGASLIVTSYVAGGTTKTIQVAMSATTYQHVVITWSKSADQYRFYLNGVLQNTLTGLGVFAGALAIGSCVIGAAAVPASNVWNGLLAHAAIWATPLNQAQVISLASVS